VVNLAHLHPSIHALAMLPAAERLAHCGTEHWIGYTRANSVLARMEALYVDEPGKVRPHNLLLVGPSNNGKTMLAQKFCRAHPQRTSDDGEHEIIPVLMIQMPGAATPTRLHTALLGALGSPVGYYARPDVRKTFAMRLMREVEVRMLIIDELHNLLGARATRQREMLSLLRFLGNDLRIPLVCLGIRDAYLAIRSDDQLENRFHPCLLPLWEHGEDYARLLTSFESVLPLREPSYLAVPDLADLILRRSEGTIGEIAELLSCATTAALEQSAEHIDHASIERADYQPPSVRRQMMERELR
jgi:hypothetical protein